MAKSKSANYSASFNFWGDLIISSRDKGIKINTDAVKKAQDNLIYLRPIRDAVVLKIKDICGYACTIINSKICIFTADEDARLKIESMLTDEERKHISVAILEKSKPMDKKPKISNKRASA